MAHSNSDIRLLFVTRILRLFAYGFLSISIALYLTKLGFSEPTVGFLFTLALLGDAVISLGITTTADRLGRRRMLVVGAGLIILAGLVFALTDNIVWIAVAALVGVISPSGNEVGPFLSIEQAALSQSLDDRQRTRIFAWYNLAGSFATALGALAGGGLIQLLHYQGWSELAPYRLALIFYAFLGLVLAGLFMQLTPAVESKQPKTEAAFRRFGLTHSHIIVLKLSGLFSLDAFAGGLIIQSLLAYWFYKRFGVDPAVLGSIFFGANILAGISALLAARIAARFGLINTMVFTHIPSNILLILVPFMPNLPAAIIVLLLRFSISQMDVPTRQSYIMAVVSPEERSAAAGVTTIARSVGALISPSISGRLLAIPSLVNAPFLLAGGLKIIYDLLLYRSFRAVKPPEEIINKV
jgi:MFS family permease